MTILAFVLGAICAILGIAQVLSHKSNVPFFMRLLSLLLGVAPGMAGARFALAHQLPEAFFLDAVAFLFLIFTVRIVARVHRTEGVRS